ncbi:MAG: glutamate--cysteine ligase [Gammaproteobacteria bacterium]|nr:MAG: glutamate--cysteine ligase [Gammaproteobacteria bacterium]TND04953.1 MAG: glutamate--cysteine ligase [Gammaproteobacteria bacterium]
MQTEPQFLGLFEGYGIELEYMIVDAETLDVLPITDQVLHAVTGEFAQEVETGELAWSNELALHVIEIKTNGPATALAPLPEYFAKDITRINQLLGPLGGRLMPTAMHPWMDPLTETRLWPHHDSPIYETFDRIFSCSGHGWSNLQSVHVNLPFANDREFAKLHAATRLMLPILPALVASSPVIEWRATGILDNRVNVYRSNSHKLPSISGLVVPEQFYTKRDYEQNILEPIYRDLAPYDPDGVLCHEWVNSRGAIARFDRNTIEIRLMDIQECPLADLATAALVSETIRAHTEELWLSLAAQKKWKIEPLHEILLQTMTDGDQAVIDNRRYLQVFGYPEGNKCRAVELWQHIIETLSPGIHARQQWQEAWDILTQRGPLARRILTAVGDRPTHDDIRAVYRQLCACLGAGKMFVG